MENGTTTTLDANEAVPADAALVRRVVDTASLPAADGFIIQGEEDNFLGVSAVGAGDINGDGIGDLIVGAPPDSCFDASEGRAYIVYGKAGPTGTQFGEAVTISVSLDTSVQSRPQNGDRDYHRRSRPR